MDHGGGDGDVSFSFCLKSLSFSKGSTNYHLSLYDHLGNSNELSSDYLSPQSVIKAQLSSLQ